MKETNGTEVLGFPNRGGVARPEVSIRPTPLPKRPKGRWFVGVILVGFCAFAVYNVWHSYFRYRAYGTVTGRTLQIALPWDGTVQALHVREGDRVRQGQLLMTIDNRELRERQSQLADELRLAQASLSAEVAKLKWQAASHVVDRHGLAVAEYYEEWGKLHQEQAKLESLRLALVRANQLGRGKAISRAEYDDLYHAHAGQEQKVAMLTKAVGELKTRSDQASDLIRKRDDARGGLVEQGHDQLKPFAVKIESVQAEMTRNQERLGRCELSAPVNGLVVKVLRFVGEYCKKAEPVFLFLEEGSLQVVLYLPQEASTLLALGDDVDLAVDPNSEPVRCTLIRLGDQYEPAPEHIKRHYCEGQKLLPAYLQPRDEQTRWLALRVGGVVKLPRSW